MPTNILCPIRAYQDVANRSKIRRRAASSAGLIEARRKRLAAAEPAQESAQESAQELAQGRLDPGPPGAVIGIGSNSVRLAVYGGLTPRPTPPLNQKVLCGLGPGV